MFSRKWKSEGANRKRRKKRAEKKYPKKIYRGGSNLESWSNKNKIPTKQIDDSTGVVETALLDHPFQIESKLKELSRKHKGVELQSKMIEIFNQFILDLNLKS